MGFGGTTTKGRKFPVEILTSSEVRALMGAASRQGECGVRDRALIATLFRSGLRIAEALDLMPKDVDLGTGAVAVLEGKGGKSRTVAVDGETVALIEVWLGKRAARGLNGRCPLFCTLTGGRMADVQVRQHLKALAEKAGIEKRVHPHGMRHARAVDLVKAGATLPLIQAALGHSSLKTTQTYVSHLAPTEVVDFMRGGSW